MAVMDEVEVAFPGWSRRDLERVAAEHCAGNAVIAVDPAYNQATQHRSGPPTGQDTVLRSVQER
jgi:hypothetical protein